MPFSITVQTAGKCASGLDYANVGITGVSATNLVLLNGLVAGEDVGLADIPALVTQADQLVVLEITVPIHPIPPQC